jgi:hypothetical protein
MQDALLINAPLRGFDIPLLTLTSGEGNDVETPTEIC